MRNKKTKFHVLGVLAVITVSAAAFAADGFTIGMKPKVDDYRKFSMKADVDFDGNPVQVTATTTEKITKVDADGSYTVESAQFDAKITVGGTTNDMPTDTASVVYKPNGEVSKVLGDATKATANSYRMANLMMLLDPGKPVNVGDPWSLDIKADPATGAVAAKADFKLLGEEKIGSFDTLKIKATIKETAGDTPASSDGTIWVDKTDGSMVKTEIKWVNAPLPGQFGLINATVKFDRIEK